MKHFIQNSILIGVIVAFTGCQTMFSPEINTILVKMRAKMDPQNKLSSMTSKIVEGNFRRTSSEKGSTISIKVQNPHMLRFDIIIPGKVSIVKAYDGKTAWEYSTKTGYKQLTGNAFNAIKFQAAFINPSIRAEDIFKNIKIDGEEKVMGQMCYKLICEPKAEYDAQNIVMYVDKQSYLLRKRVETQKQGTTGTETFTVSTIMLSYKDYDGILVPTTVISKVNNNLMELEVTSVRWNEKIPVSAFDPPEQMQ